MGDILTIRINSLGETLKSIWVVAQAATPDVTGGFSDLTPIPIAR